MQRPPNRSLEHHRVGRNYNRRKRAARQAEAAEPTEQQPLSHRRLEEQAVREGWLSHGSERDRIIDRLLRVIDRDDEVDDMGNSINCDRYATSAAKTLIYADLGQRRLNLQERQLADRQSAATRTAGETLSESGAEPLKRIIIPDADDRLDKRED